MGMDVFGHSGNYFRANIWSWRAIIDVMEQSGIEVPGDWSFNDGAGSDDPNECQNMADSIDTFLNRNRDESFSVESSRGLAVDENGRFVPAGTEGAVSPYCVYRDHLIEFVAFLRECDGFEIC
ncbi:MAG: hypothetical protein AAFW68_13815 [Pseudomonadota bacterium]